MKITTNLKNRLLVAKKMGYENIYSTLGSYMATVYVDEYSIQHLLDMKIGEKKESLCRFNNRWAGCLNTRQIDHKKSIMYSQLFGERFGNNLA